MKIFVMLLVSFYMLVASVDINKADAKELLSLKGIGKTKVAAILKYRETNCFKTISDLSKVKGIGKKLVEKNKTQITVSECSK